MHGTLSIKSSNAVSVSPELRQLVIDACSQHGVGVQVPSDVVQKACSDLSSRTTVEILEIRRLERSVRPDTLALSFA